MQFENKLNEFSEFHNWRLVQFVERGQIIARKVLRFDDNQIGLADVTPHTSLSSSIFGNSMGRRQSADRGIPCTAVSVFVHVCLCVQQQ